MTPHFSIVIPVYQNEGCLKPLMQSLDDKVLQANQNYTAEVIFIDDGSADASFEELRQIQRQFPGVVTIIKLTRNFGQARALLAGYHHAKGRCVITMSADGQDPPEMINEMLTAFFDEKYDVVICAREGREESAYRIITSRIFYWLMKRLTFTNMPTGGFDFWLLSRRASDALVRNADEHPFLQGQILWLGYRTKMLSYYRRGRLAGVSALSFAKKYTAFLAAVLAYTFAPIRIMSLVGCVFAFLGFVYAACILVDFVLFGNPVKGWAPLMIMMLVMGGCQMLMLGIIGEYLWRTSTQVRHRDYYIVDAFYGSNSTGSSSEEAQEQSRAAAH